MTRELDPAEALAAALFPDLATSAASAYSDPLCRPACAHCDAAAEVWADQLAQVRAALSAADLAPAADLARARATIAELMADFVASPEPGNPYRLDSVKAAVAELEKAAGLPPGSGYDSGAVFRARLAAGHIGGRFKAPYLGADLEPLGRAAERLAEAERAEAGAGQLLDRAEAAAKAGQPWAEAAEIAIMRDRLGIATRDCQRVAAAFRAELEKARAGGLI